MRLLVEFWARTRSRLAGIRGWRRFIAIGGFSAIVLTVGVVVASLGGGDGPTPKPVGESGWRLGTYLDVGKERIPIGGGTARTTPEGKVVAMDAWSQLGDINSRFVVSEEGRFLGSTVKGRDMWIDVSDPSGPLAVADLPDLREPPGDPVRTAKLGDEEYAVYVAAGSVWSADDGVGTVLFESWVDGAGEVRRLVSRTALVKEDGGRVDVVTMADRADDVDVSPPFISRSDAVPAAAALRRLNQLGPSPASRTAESKGGDTRRGAARGASVVLAASAARPVHDSPFRARPSLFAQAPAAPGNDCQFLGGRVVPRGDGGYHIPEPEWDCPRGQRPPEPPVVRFKDPPDVDSPQLGDQPTLEDVGDKPTITYPWGSRRVVFTVCKDNVELLQKLGLGFAQAGVGAAAMFKAVTYVMTATGPVVLVGFGLFAVSSGVVIAATIEMSDCIKTKLFNDPHLTTLDGHDYEFMAAGEFVYFSSPALEVQTRFEGTVGKATWTTATAVRVGGHVIESYHEPSTSDDARDGLPVVLDGQERTVDFAGQAFPDGTFVARQSGGEDDRNLLVVDPEGSWVLIKNLNQSQNVSAGLAQTRATPKVRGLAGTPDGDRTNDFTLRGGNVLGFADVRTVKGLYGRFATSWRVKPAERLFSRGKAADYRTDDYTKLPTKLRSLADFTPSEVADARATCERQGVADPAILEDCAYDVLVAGTEWARQTGNGSLGDRESATVGVEKGQRVGDHPLLVSADRCRPEDIRDALDDEADPNLRREEDGETPLLFAAQSGCLRGVKLLLASGADSDLADDEGFTPLYVAAQNGHLDVVRALVNAGGDVNRLLPSGDGPLLTAAFHGHDDVVSFLVKAGAPVDVARIDDGFTPLLAAVQEGQRDVVQTLLAAGADPARTDNDGLTPLMVAADQDSAQLIRRLARARAGVDQARPSDGATALMFAADGEAAAVDALLQAGADPNRADDDGGTALHIAASNGARDIVEALLAAGANPASKDARGRTPRDVADSNVAGLL